MHLQADRSDIITGSLLSDILLRQLSVLLGSQKSVRSDLTFSPPSTLLFLCLPSSSCAEQSYIGRFRPIFLTSQILLCKTLGYAHVRVETLTLLTRNRRVISLELCSTWVLLLLTHKLMSRPGEMLRLPECHWLIQPRYSSSSPFRKSVSR